MRVAVLGVGLIGGSIGLALRRRTGARVIGYDPEGGALSSAMEMGAIDEPAFKVSDAVRDADAVFVASPVGVSVETARQALAAAREDCVVSDVGSTKRQIAQAVSDARFVGGHPLAGAETGGVKHAREDLFEGATWYLTPPAGSTWAVAGVSSRLKADLPPVDVAPWAVERLRGLLERIGARPVAIDPVTHDRLMASVSHLPHVFANVLVAQANRALDSDETILRGGTLGAGRSFYDATRVAGANTAIWTDIYLSNADLLAHTIDGAIEELGRVRDALLAAAGETLAAWNERACAEHERLTKRGAFGAGAGLAQDS